MGEDLSYRAASRTALAVEEEVTFYRSKRQKAHRAAMESGTYDGLKNRFYNG